MPWSWGLRSAKKFALPHVGGEIEIPVCVTFQPPQGTVFIPFHFFEAAANRLTNPALDPIGKIPELKVCAVKVEKLG